MNAERVSASYYLPAPNRLTCLTKCFIKDNIITFSARSNLLFISSYLVIIFTHFKNYSQFPDFKDTDGLACQHKYYEDSTLKHCNQFTFCWTNKKCQVKSHPFKLFNKHSINCHSQTNWPSQRQNKTFSDVEQFINLSACAYHKYGKIVFLLEQVVLT